MKSFNRKVNNKFQVDAPSIKSAKQNLTLGNRKSDFLKKLKEVLYNRRKFVYSSSDYLYEVF